MGARRLRRFSAAITASSKHGPDCSIHLQFATRDLLFHIPSPGGAQFQAVGGAPVCDPARPQQAANAPGRRPALHGGVGTALATTLSNSGAGPGGKMPPSTAGGTPAATGWYEQ